MVYTARPQEQQSLEEGVGEQMEKGGVVRAHAKGCHHVAQLADRGIGHYALDVVCRQAHGRGEYGGKRPNQRDDHHGRLRFREDREESSHQEHAGRNHRGGMDQRADGRRALHGVGEPGVQGELAALADRAGKQAQAQPQERSSGHDARAAGSDRSRRLPDVRDVQGVQSMGGEIVRMEEQVDYGKQETDVADAGDDECLFGRRGS